MKQKKRILQINEIKKKILICLDKFGTSEIQFGKLIQKLKNDDLSENVVRKYIGILFDDDFIDINSKVFQNRAQIKSSITKKTKIQITSAGQDYAYPKKRSKFYNFIMNQWVYTIVGAIIAGLILYFLLGK